MNFENNNVNKLKKKEEILNRGKEGDFYISAEELEELQEYFKNDKSSGFDKKGFLPKALTLGLLTLVGVTGGKDIYEHSPHQIKYRQELTDEKYKALDYTIPTIKNDTLRFLSDDFVSDIALDNNGDLNSKLLLKMKSGLLCEKEKIETKLDSGKLKDLEEVLSLCNLKINEQKEQLTEEEKVNAKEKIIEMMTLVEQAKLELVHHIGSKEYLYKLAQEMNISKEAAKEHQKIRINNIKNVSYEFENNMAIFAVTGGRGYAYYDRYKNIIVMPYNIDLKDKKDKDYFYEVLIHEILHESTQGKKGISNKAKEDFNKVFNPIVNESKEDSIYYGRAEELIVRKQILDLNMEKLGIKKYEDKFTREHYKMLKDLEKEDKLSPAEKELFEHIPKEEDFIKIINELAENNDGNYYHPEWDYGVEDKA